MKFKMLLKVKVRIYHIISVTVILFIYLCVRLWLNYQTLSNFTISSFLLLTPKLIKYASLSNRNTLSYEVFQFCPLFASVWLFLW